MADMTETFEAAAYTARGTARDSVALPSEMFDGTVNMPVMHQAVKAYLANQRQGTAATKTRGFVVGGNQKPWKQKGTGRARQGSIRAPHWVGGGTVFGPTPRDYHERVPKQVRQLAKKSAFNARARENAVIVIDAFAYDAPKTKHVASLLDRLNLGGKKVLILTDGSKPAVVLSARNLPAVHAMSFNDASTYHILWSDVVLIEAPAIGQTLEPVAEQEPTEPVKRSRTSTGKKMARRSGRDRSAAASEETGGEESAPAKKTAAKKGAAGTAKKAAGKKVAAKAAKPAAKKASKPAAKKASGSAAKKKKKGD